MPGMRQNVGSASQGCGETERVPGAACPGELRQVPLDCRVLVRATGLAGLEHQLEFGTPLKR